MSDARPARAGVRAAGVQPGGPDALGFLYTAGAFAVWGLSPLFWKAVEHVPASELVAHRVVWCALMMALLLSFRRRWGAFRRALGSPRTALMLLASTSLIAINWFLFIWAVHHARLLEASLGYFINPLVSVVLGMLFLGERLRPWQALSVTLAAAGVTVLAVHLGQLPWISLALALSFGFYGLVRKTVDATPEQGLALETGLLMPFMIVYLLRLEAAGSGAFGRFDLSTDLLLVATGTVTAVPLLWFTHGARRLPLATVGILQYLAPTGQFLLAVLVFRESFDRTRLIAFGLIWAALVVFTLETRVHWRRARAAALPPAA